MRVLEVLLVAAMPIAEIRGALPLALYYGFDPVSAYLLAFAGNLLPIPVLLVFLDWFVKLATKVRFLDKIYRRIVARVEKRKEIIEKYGYLGLTMFVAIPLPITGAWTGSLLAFLLRLNKLKAFLAISAGVSAAGMIVMATSLGILSLLTG